MNDMQNQVYTWVSALRRYLGVSFAANLVWEVLQLPLFTLWTTGTIRQQAFAVLHCTAGDVMIAALSLLAAVSLFAHSTWPATNVARVYATTLALGLSYTFYSEWLNTSVRGNWAYSTLMPLVPFVGTGLSPVLQWLAIPTLVHWIAVGHRPWADRTSAKQ
jgi:hypothetical protein